MKTERIINEHYVDEKCRAYGMSQDEIQTELVKKLIQKGIKISTAESCTGGLVSKKITEVSGASEIFECGVCSYANEIKNRVLGVENSVLEKYGAVSYETACQMAQGVKNLAKAQIGISTTGVAGPTGGIPEKPVGLVYMGVCVNDSVFAVRGEFFKTSGRENIREAAAKTVLLLAFEEVSKL